MPNSEQQSADWDHEHEPHDDRYRGLDESGAELWDEHCWCGHKIRRKRWDESSGWRTA